MDAGPLHWLLTAVGPLGGPYSVPSSEWSGSTAPCTRTMQGPAEPSCLRPSKVCCCKGGKANLMRSEIMHVSLF